MKKILAIIIILVAVCLAVYFLTHITINASLNEKFCLWEKQSAMLKSEGLKITLVNAIYSPCPEGAMCFWSGIGAVINVTHVGDSTQFLTQGGRDVFGYEITTSEFGNFRSCFVVNKLE